MAVNHAGDGFSSLGHCIVHTKLLASTVSRYRSAALRCGGFFPSSSAGLGWPDAKNIAAAVSFDVCTRDDAADFLRNRARNVLAGTDNMPWENREGAARALNIAAAVLTF